MSFYQTPFPNMIKSWINNTPDNFIFSIKASRFITHVKKITNINDSIIKLYQLADNFKNKCKCILFQFPPTFYADEVNLNKLKNLLNLFNFNYNHSIEFRHESWWNNECYELLNKKAAFCIVDGLGMPDELIATNDFLYIRFHGQRYNTIYSENELKKYSEKIKDFSKKKSIKNVYIYFNNDANCFAVKNAIYLKELL